jgi:putative spermidine/putrescine transport system ATP-binding protein
MDEPLGALDKQLREQMQYEIKHIHENLGVTVVYVTHDQTEALTMSDRVAVFNDGVIQQLSTPEQLYEHPANSFVAQFIGENNKLSGRVERIENGVCDVVLDTGPLVRGEAVNVGGEGARTTLSLRPERVAIDPVQADTVLDGRIEELIYLGETIRARLSVAGKDDFIVKVPNRGDDGHRLVEGATVKVGWRVSDCHALDPVAV